MDLNSLRKEIDNIDEEMLSLFIKRMGLCRDVAEYKRVNNLPVLQGGRETEILERVRGESPAWLKDGAGVFFSNIMDISKCLQQKSLAEGDKLSPAPFLPQNAGAVACQGVPGANSEAAARKLFGDTPIKFCREFEDVFLAVESGETDYGILPIQNSTAGSVTQTYELMAKYDFFVPALVQVEITHVLAVKPHTLQKDITKVYSHPQALSQCSEFLKKNSLTSESYINTAAAAQLVMNSDEPIAAICSKECAELYGLEILSDRIANAYPNLTRFICICKSFESPEDASSIAVSLRLPNTQGSLYKLLTKFMVSGLNLERIESKTIAGENFEVMFYLDFSGNINDEIVIALIRELKEELSYFKFLGNYKEVI